MSREELIHTLRNALESLTDMVRDEDQDIQVPEIDEEIVALAEGKRQEPPRLPLSW